MKQEVWSYFHQITEPLLMQSYVILFFVSFGCVFVDLRLGARVKSGNSRVNSRITGFFYCLFRSPRFFRTSSPSAHQRWGAWSSGMIHPWYKWNHCASGARGRGFDSRCSPLFFLLFLASPRSILRVPTGIRPNGHNGRPAWRWSVRPASDATVFYCVFRWHYVHA